jgi:predicted dehydrogenase
MGVLGAGYLGRTHMKLLQQLEGVRVLGFHDPDAGNTRTAEQEFGLPAYLSPEALLDEVEAVVIVSSTPAHFSNAEAALSRGVHVFIEKPLAATLDEARALTRLVQEAGVVAQVGHVERFNPAFLALKGQQVEPLFIEAHRLAPFGPRGTEVPVVSDLMIHDIDLVLALVKSPLRDVHASGVAVITDSPDIANARLEFANGCVANLTASRISLKTMRRMRIFQKDAYITLDFAEKQCQMFRLADGEVEGAPYIEVNTGGRYARRYIALSQPPAPQINALLEELRQFRDCIRGGGEPDVSVWDGYRAQEVASRILERIQTAQPA